LLAHGALLQEDRQRAIYVVEPRTGAIGTDKNSVLIGVPALSLPPLVPGIPTTIPEIALIKNTDQKGVAKIAVFAYNRVTGRALWQSGTKEADSNLEDTWVFGAGPYSRGSIRPKAQIAGEEIPSLSLPFGGEKQSDPSLTTQAERYDAPNPSEPHEWTNADAPPKPQPVPLALLGLTGPAAAADRRIIRFGMPLPEDQAVQSVQPTVPVPPRAPTVPVSAPTPKSIQPPPYPLPKVN
jgi:hypothetical protein